MKYSMSKPEKITIFNKEIGSTQIHADVFLPKLPPSKSMSVGLMLHGGGHMMLSRNAIRPAQKMHLLANDILPISLDYRLAPEINTDDGAMADVRDAMTWVRQSLPALIGKRSILIDTERVIVIGWSTGGHLAMLTAWTVESTGQLPPKAILSFYSPTNFLTENVFQAARTSENTHEKSIEQLMAVDLLASPLTSYHSNGAEDLDLG
jgi:acetyl esterase/lipase